MECMHSSMATPSSKAGPSESGSMEVNTNINAKQILCYICYAEFGRYIKQNGLQAAGTDVGLVLPALPNLEYQNWKSGGFVFVIDTMKLGQAFQGFCRFLTWHHRG
jgi:hypothetical protein